MNQSDIQIISYHGGNQLERALVISCIKAIQHADITNLLQLEDHIYEFIAANRERFPRSPIQKIVVVQGKYRGHDALLLLHDCQSFYFSTLLIATQKII